MTAITQKGANPTPEQESQVLTKALLKAATKLQLSRRQLSQIIGISEASLSRIYDGKRFIDVASKEGELAILLLRLFRSLDTLLGGNEVQLQQWLHNYNFHLNGTPIEILQSVTGLSQVVHYLDAMRGKI